MAHGFASNTASNRSAANHERVRASNAVGLVLGPERVDVVAPGRGVGSGVTKQRWPRESYNAYQREYMRKRRLRVLDAVGVDQVELGLCRT